MENATQNVKVSDFQITRYPDALGGDCFHFSAKHPDGKFSGFGTAFDEKLALKIAISESIERFCYQRLQQDLEAKSSSGFAVHETQELAAEGAQCELLERDAVLCAWLLKQPPQWFSESELDPFLKEQTSLFYSNGFDIKFGLLRISNGRFCCLGALLPYDNRHSFGAVFSASCNQNLIKSQESILKELRRAATVIFNRGAEENPPRPKLNLHMTAQDHFDYYANPLNLPKAKWLFEGTLSQPRESNFQVNIKTFQPLLNPSWPLYGAHASSSKLQNLYFGLSTFARINRRRLRKEWQRGQKLNKDLHILP
ncbi:MAG: YcaO-like family protein [Bdellovibrionales bacterium]|nr:YcaO-like family protein [Bdellovibrionales bacterium]